ncbi:MAG TPA: hypothetical protein VF736_07365 [Pyrinomonadaceae bacterium]|jgi:hypothetical protein
MKTYEYYGNSPDGWKVSGTLEVEGNERFGYSEGWTDYTNASLSGGATGTWRREGNVLLFRVEKVYTPIYFPWSVGGVLPAVERGDELDFGNGWTLSLKTIPIKEITVRNGSAKPKPLVLEPWGIRRTLAPGERVRIVTQGEFFYGQAEKRVEYGADEIVYRGWGGTWATIVPEPQRPSAEVAEPAAEPPIKPQVTAPAPFPTGARFVPRKPSRELATLLFKWVNELDPYDPVSRVNRVCRVHGAIPLGGNESEAWMLRTDGLVLRFEPDKFAPPAEPEEDAEVAYGMIAAGAERHPELSELLPPDRRND